MGPVQPFSDPVMIAGYAEATPQRVPGFGDLHRMAVTLLAERAADNARFLVLGAGGGLELKAFTQARPDWTFVGVDPSQPMLDLAAQVLGPHVSQVELIHGYIDDAPVGPFDGATRLLMLHFLPVPDRLDVLRALKDRLKPGAPLIIAHHCNPGVGPAEDWLARSVAFANGPMADAKAARASAAGMAQHLTLLTAQQEEALLQDAGFIQPALFYAGLSFRGWVASALA
jgi:tRNA (cmo5U34)-methyltransferase